MLHSFAEEERVHRLEQLAALAREFVAYWTTDRSHGGPERSHDPEQVGCGMCGGIPHSSTCYVGRMAALLPAGGNEFTITSRCDETVTLPDGRVERCILGVTDGQPHAVHQYLDDIRINTEHLVTNVPGRGHGPTFLAVMQALSEADRIHFGKVDEALTDEGIAWNPCPNCAQPLEIPLAGCAVDHPRTLAAWLAVGRRNDGTFKPILKGQP